MRDPSFFGRRSPLAKVLVIAFVVIFVLLCGVHLAGAHHDADTDSLGLAIDLFVLTLLAALPLVVGSAANNETTFRSLVSHRARLGGLSSAVTCAISGAGVRLRR